LIADGHADAADSLAMLLTIWGHEAHVARSGPAALDACHALRPDVLLAEIVLPGLDGLALAGRLRDEMLWAGTLMVALTVLGDPASRRRTWEAGYLYHLVKPVASGVLQALLEAARRTEDVAWNTTLPPGTSCTSGRP
jgi:DNA-binding response OmpR family regulator